MFLKEAALSIVKSEERLPGWRRCVGGLSWALLKVDLVGTFFPFDTSLLLVIIYYPAFAL